MIPLILLSIMVLTIGIERYLALRREKVFPAELIAQPSSLSQSHGGLDPPRAYQVCQQFPSSALTFCDPCWSKSDALNWKWIALLPKPASQREATRSSWIKIPISQVAWRKAIKIMFRAQTL